MAKLGNHTSELTIAIIAAGTRPYGATRSMVALIKALETRTSFRFVVLLRRGSEPVQRFLQANGVRFIVVPYHQSVYRLSPTRAKGQLLIHGVRSKASCMRSHVVNKWQAYVWSRRLRHVSLVHSNNLVSSFGLELASKLKVPHIQHIREYLAEDYSIAICAEDHFRSRNLEAKTLFVALSNDLRETYVERGLVSSRFIRVINNPLQDLTGSAKRGTYRTIGEELRVCLPGRIFPGKNQLEAVLAIGHIKKLRPSLRVTLVLYGDADEDYKSKLLAAATSLGVGDQLVFAGFSDRLLDDLKEFHVGLACSRREVFARTVIEMMSLGLPVIAPQSGGFVEQLEDGCTGLLYSPGDATELAQKMLTLADDLELRRTLGGNARESATNRFSPEKFAQLMSDVYEEALSL